jgi:hypothetical protein
LAIGNKACQQGSPAILSIARLIPDKRYQAQYAEFSINAFHVESKQIYASCDSKKLACLYLHRTSAGQHAAANSDQVGQR